MFKDDTVVLLSKTLQALGDRHTDINSLLKSHGIEPDKLKQHNLYLPFDRYLALIGEILDHTNIPGLGLLTGQQFVTAELGIFGYALTCSENLGKALKRYERFQGLTLPIPKLKFEYTPKSVTLSAEPNRLPPRLHRFFTEEWTVHWALVGQRFGEPHQWLSEVHYKFPEPDYSEMYREFFGCPIFFNQPADKICFASRHLGTPYLAGDETIATFCEHQLEAMLSDHRPEESLAEDIRQIVMHSEGQMPGMEEIAEMLHMSPRNLHRRLQAEGTSYKDILSGFRKTLAHEYLCKSDMPIKNIAELLGYSDVSNFHRAFQKWFDQTPAAYREAHDDPSNNS